MLEPPASALYTLSTLYNSSWLSSDDEMTQPDKRQTEHISERQTGIKRNTTCPLSVWEVSSVTWQFCSSYTHSSLLTTRTDVFTSYRTVCATGALVYQCQRGRPRITQNQVYLADKLAQTQRHSSQWSDKATITIRLTTGLCHSGL